MKKHTFLLQKLARDKIVEQTEAEGGTVEYRVLEDPVEFLDALTQKIVEELEEVFSAENKEELIKELADVEEVLAAFKKLVNIDQKDIDAARAEKLKLKGGFTKRHYIETMTVPAGSRLYKYCKADPNKYPEVNEE